MGLDACSRLCIQCMQPMQRHGGAVPKYCHEDKRGDNRLNVATCLQGPEGRCVKASSRTEADGKLHGACLSPTLPKRSALRSHSDRHDLRYVPDRIYRWEISSNAKSTAFCPNPSPQQQEPDFGSQRRGQQDSSPPTWVCGAAPCLSCRPVAASPPPPKLICSTLTVNPR